MRIARICRPLVQAAGTERSIIESSLELLRQNHEVRIYTPTVNKGLFGGVIRKLQVETTPIRILPFLSLYNDLLVVEKLAHHASKWADVILIHHGHPLASYVSKRFGIPSVPYYHIDRRDWALLWGNFRHIAPLYSLALDCLEYRSLQEVPLVLANSLDLSQRIRMFSPKANVVPILLGIDSTRFRPLPGRDDHFVMMSGRFIPANNFELGLEAVKDTPYRMIIAGIVERTSSSYYQHILKTIQQDEQLREKVQLETPSEAGLIDLLQRCSVYLSPRKYYYLGRAALEAMACGKPVVAYRPPSGLEGAPPVVQCRDEPEEWKATISSLMDDAEARQNLGRRACEYVAERHTLRRSVQKTLSSIMEFVFGREGFEHVTTHSPAPYS